MVPGSVPTNAWPAIDTYVQGGGRVMVEFWDWDNNSGYGSPALLNTFQVSAPVTITFPTSPPLQDSGLTPAFTGVTMPNSDWHNHSADDGDLFTPLGGAIGMAHFGNPAQPTMVLGNSGRTIAAPLLSEVGDTWIIDGSIDKLYKNLLGILLTGGCGQLTATVLSRVGVPANPNVLQVLPFTGPQLGKPWLPLVDHSVFLPSAILDVASVCVVQLNLPIATGTLLVDLGTQIGFQVVNAGQTFAFMVPFNCALVGAGVSMQVGSLSATQLALTNALDVVIGTP